jgi:hypothetical protein
MVAAPVQLGVDNDGRRRRLSRSESGMFPVNESIKF